MRRVETVHLQHRSLVQTAGNSANINSARGQVHQRLASVASTITIAITLTAVATGAPAAAVRRDALWRQG